MDNTLYQLGTTLDGIQIAMIDMITKSAPVLASMPFAKTSHGNYNVFERLIDVDAVEQIDFDSTYPEIGLKTQLGQTDMAKFGGKMTVGKDAAMNLHPGMSPREAAQAYFTKRLPKIARRTAQSIDYTMIYNFMRSIAYSASKLEDAAGSNNANYTMLCVRWEEGENTGLYNPIMKDNANISEDTILDFYLLNRGNLAEVTKGGLTYPGFIGILETYLAAQIENTNFIAGIKNIDLDLSGGSPKNPPTSTMVQKMIRDAEADEMNSYIYCHPAVRDYLSVTYATAVTTAPMSFGNYEMRITSWNGIPIITSRNFLDGTEANL